MLFYRKEISKIPTRASNRGGKLQAEKAQCGDSGFYYYILQLPSNEITWTLHFKLLAVMILPNLIYQGNNLFLPAKLQPAASLPDGKPACPPCVPAHGRECTAAYPHIMLRQPQTGWDVFLLSSVKSSLELWARCWNKPERTGTKQKGNELA